MPPYPWYYGGQWKGHFFLERCLERIKDREVVGWYRISGFHQLSAVLYLSAWFGKRADPDHRNRVCKAVEVVNCGARGRPVEAGSRPDYSADAFGLSDDLIRDQFGDYIARFRAI